MRKRDKLDLLKELLNCETRGFPRHAAQLIADALDAIEPDDDRTRDLARTVADDFRAVAKSRGGTSVAAGATTKELEHAADLHSSLQHYADLAQALSAAQSAEQKAAAINALEDFTTNYVSELLDAIQL